VRALPEKRGAVQARRVYGVTVVGLAEDAVGAGGRRLINASHAALADG
jgi:hypothetical protein